MRKYLFVLTAYGWLLKISSIEELENCRFSDIQCTSFPIYVNAVGELVDDYLYSVAYEYRNNCIFPEYSRSDLRFSTFKGDQCCNNYSYHYYAYIGNAQLHDGNCYKWNSLEAAKEFAYRFVV